MMIVCLFSEILLWAYQEGMRGETGTKKPQQGATERNYLLEFLLQHHSNTDYPQKKSDSFS